MNAPLAGIFVGGAGTRMGGHAKGLLRAPDGRAIVERCASMLEALGAEVVLVGTRSEYAHLGFECIGDQPPGIGPLGGIVALLQRARASHAVALACDMPFLSPALLARLLTELLEVSVLAPKRDGHWESLCARYEVARVLPIAIGQVRSQNHSLQRLLDSAGATEFRLAPGEVDQLRDWDSPEDIV